MWWLFNVDREKWVVCVDGVEARALNLLNHDFPWLIVRKRT